MPRSAALAALVIVAGCGGGSHTRPAAQPRPHKAAPSTPSSPAPRARRAPQRNVAVVKAWVDSLRAGRLRKASSYFAVPAVVQNGGPPIELRTRAAVRLFNASLPCGARFVRAVATPHYTVVTFKLTERVGSASGCGSGAGSLAATAFAFRHGRISEWRRVVVPAEDQAPAV